jgi:hypothetical protein
MLKSSILAGCLFLICAVSASAQALEPYLKCSGQTHSASAQSLNTYSTRKPAHGPNFYGGKLPPLVVTPKMRAERLRLDQVAFYNKIGTEELGDGNGAHAEEDFRQALALDEAYTPSYEGLALALVAEGQKAEAIQVYRKIFYEFPVRGVQSPTDSGSVAFQADVLRNPVAHGGSGSASLEDGLTYALLLNETRQWAEAVTVYESALPLLPGGDLPKVDIHFSQDKPQPLELEAAAHIALGLDLSFTGWEDSLSAGQNHKAMKNYAAALRLEPEWPLANYYYSYGWQRLEPADRAKFASAQQAKATLQKAVKIGKGDVRKAAQKALKNAG